MAVTILDSIDASTVDAQAGRSEHLDYVTARPYELWQERGCPIGSPEVDWFRAEQELGAPSDERVASNSVNEAVLAKSV